MKLTRYHSLSLLLLWCAAGAWAQSSSSIGVTELTMNPDGGDARVRPLESVVLQIRAYGEIAKSGGGTDRVRLQRSGATVSILTPNGGWLSKPFKYQGRETEAFYQDVTSRFAAIFGAISKDYLYQDSHLYTAPEIAGRYDIEADLGGKKGRLTIEVTGDAPSRRPAETATYPLDPRPPDPYRLLAEYWSPFLAQETWFQPKSDMPARFDFDGDWNGDNNWENLDTGSSQAYVYYAPIETATHWFLIYNVFHPRDYSDKCVVGTCHENDNEGLILTIRKDGSEFGKLEVMETLAHNNVYSFVNDGRIRKGVHNIDGPVEFYEDSHPVVFIESGGHGILGSTANHAAYDLKTDTFKSGSGMTFVYQGTAEKPRHSNDRLVGYELLPIHQYWWSKSADEKWGSRTFDEFFVYTPFGGRPAGNGKRMGGTFLGRKESSNKSKPFWGWHDNATLKKNILAPGQWALDPAYAVSKNVSYPYGMEPSVDYTFNPYLNIE